MLAMLLLAGGDEPLDLALRLLGRFQVHQVLFRTIPVVRQNLLRTLPRLLLDGFHHRLQLLLVIRRFRHRLPHDQQHLRFYRCLRIVALHQPVGTLHNARLRIGEVVLILVLRLSLLGLSGAFALGRCFFPCSLLHHLLGPIGSSPAAFPAAATPPATRRPAGCRVDGLLPHRQPRPAPAVASLLIAVALAFPSSLRSSSPCACWRWLSPSSRPVRPAPLSPRLLPTPSPRPARTIPVMSRCGSCESPRSFGSRARCPPPIP